MTLPPTPWKESCPRVEDPEIASRIFYYRQLDLLEKHAKGQVWKWTEVRPDAVIGYAPTASTAMNLPLLLGIFFSLWKQVNGPGSTIPFPASKAAYRATHIDTPAGASARFQIFASLIDGSISEQAYNFGGPVTSWAEKWPLMAAYFGLVGVGPHEDDGIDAAEWVKQHKGAWSVLEKEHSLKAGIIDVTDWDFFFMIYITLDRQLDTTRSQELGFDEVSDIVAPYKETWGLMANAGLLPPVLQ